jgi:hypothetical protein
MYYYMRCVEWATVFDILKKKPAPEKNKVTKKPETAEKPQAAKPQKHQKKAKKPAKPEPTKAKQAEPEEDTEYIAPQVHETTKDAEEPFVCVKEYGSAVEISEKLDREIAATKSALGKYLRRLDNKRTVAEKAKRLHDVVAKLSNKKEVKENPNQIKVNGLEIVLDATPLNELTAMESVVKSHQQRLLALQKAQEALETLDQAGDTEGIRYLVLEKEGVPEQILLKLT